MRFAGADNFSESQCEKGKRNGERKAHHAGKDPELLPRFSCHSLRHTFTTRLVEAGVNLKVIQDALGHKDFSTAMDIYTDVIKELSKGNLTAYRRRWDVKRIKGKAAWNQINSWKNISCSHIRRIIIAFLFDSPDFIDCVPEIAYNICRSNSDKRRVQP